MTTLANDIVNARRVSTPLIAIRTADASNLIARLIPALSRTHDDTETCGLVLWDCVRGISLLTESTESRAIKESLASTIGNPMALKNPVAMLDAAQGIPANAVIFMHNAHLTLADPQVRQALWNLRDSFKFNGRSVILLGRSMTLPAELDGDVIVFDDPLPDRKQAESIILSVFEQIDTPKPSREHLDKSIDAVTGLSPFSIEQIAALAVNEETIDVKSLQERRCAVIEQTPGLSVLNGKETFKTVGGCDNAKTFFERLAHGKDAPTAIVFIDEIEKALGGVAGDTSGTSQDQLMQVLMFMQDKRSSGVMFIGHPGCSKSALAKAIGNESGVLTIQFDMGAMKGSLVGQSEARIREALRVIDAVSAGRALFIATCNRISGLPPELRRRFKLGTFFFGLPTAAEREAIWTIYLNKFKIGNQPRPKDVGWTGAEIEQCCEIAWKLQCTLIDASQYIVPITISSKEKIKALCEEADMKFISASRPGVYSYSENEGALDAPQSTGRRISTKSA